MASSSELRSRTANNKKSKKQSPAASAAPDPSNASDLNSVK